jgi:hypothetical protein
VKPRFAAIDGMMGLVGEGFVNILDRILGRTPQWTEEVWTIRAQIIELPLPYETMGYYLAEIARWPEHAARLLDEARYVRSAEARWKRGYAHEVEKDRLEALDLTTVPPEAAKLIRETIEARRMRRPPQSWRQEL